MYDYNSFVWFDGVVGFRGNFFFDYVFSVSYGEGFGMVFCDSDSGISFISDEFENVIDGFVWNGYGDEIFFLLIDWDYYFV